MTISIVTISIIFPISLIVSYMSLLDKPFYDKLHKKIMPQLLLLLALILTGRFLFAQSLVNITTTTAILLLAIAGIALAYAYNYPILLFSSMIALWIRWADIILSINYSTLSLFFSGCMIFAITICTVGLLNKNKTFRYIYTILGSLSYFISLIFYISDEYKKVIINKELIKLVAPTIITMIMISLIALWFIWKQHKKIMLFLLPISFIIFALTLPLLNVTTATGLIVKDFLMLIIYLGLAYIGINLEQAWLINTGIGCLFVYTLIRLYGWFQTTDISIGIFLIVAGIIIMTLGYILEKSRQILINTIKKKIKKS